MSRHQSTPREDIYARVTNAIISELEAGVRPWSKPWDAQNRAGPVSRPLRSTGEPYSGMNVLLLWSEALSRGFSAPIWMTFRQALALGGHVRRGSRGATVVHAGTLQREAEDPNGEHSQRKIPFLKTYTVFNVEQVEGLPAEVYGAAPARLAADCRLAHAEAFFAATRAQVRHGGDRAFYAPVPDHIQLPPFTSFEDAPAYYATLAHELVHWTGHGSRLDRDFGRQRWGDEGYAREELVAEIGATFLCADLGLELTPRADHASYIADWLEVLRNDRRFVFAAAAHAQRACAFLHGFSLPKADAA